MRRFFHMPLDPACRLVRFALAEKGLPAQAIESYPWQTDVDLTQINPAGALPTLIDDAGLSGAQTLAPASVIVEYLEEAYPQPALFPNGAAARAETRRLISWFTEKFDIEVIEYTVRERVDKRLMGRGQADYDVLRAGLNALEWHMDYFSWLLDQRPWFAGETFSCADVAAGAYIASLDYVDAVNWNHHAAVHEWYARIKSRPAFRPILKDRIEGLPPPRHYDDPDF